MALIPKHARFVSEYLKDLNATQAAIRAGYKAKWAEKNAHRLTGNDGVAVAIAAGQARQLQAADLSAVRVLEEYRRLAFNDLRSFFDTDGNLKPVSALTPEQGSALASFEVIKKNAAAGDGVIDTVHKFKVWDKTKALDSLAKHYGLLEEKFDIHGEVVITWQK